jgi:GNAT superfamily N-acetyltransferase
MDAEPGSGEPAAAAPRRDLAWRGTPMTSAATVVSPLRRGQAALAAELLTAALHDDLGWRHVVPDPGRRKVALRSITGVAVRDALTFGGVLAACDNERMQGVAVWLPPGRYPMSRRRKARTLPATAALAARLPGNISDLARFGASIDAVFPSEPVWYLQILGVHPDAQRRGIGLQLLQPTLAQADSTGVACYLETAQPRNSHYYQRVGFQELGPAAPLRPGGPPITRMIRPA